MSKIYTTPKAAKYLGRSLDGLYLYIKKGHLVGTKPYATLRLFTQQELDDFAKQWPVKKVPEKSQLIIELEHSTVKKLAKKYGVALNTIYRRLKDDD